MAIEISGFFRLFNTEPHQPWLTKRGIYFLSDFVHLMKNIRNSWPTGKMEELLFFERRMKKIARWSDLPELYKLEAGDSVKMSKLTEVSVYPISIERQSVATCLRVFASILTLLFLIILERETLMGVHIQLHLSNL